MAVDTIEQTRISLEGQLIRDSISRVFHEAIELVLQKGGRTKVAYRNNNGLLTIVPVKSQNMGQAEPTEMILDSAEKEYALIANLMEWKDMVGNIEKGAEVVNGMREQKVGNFFPGIYRGIERKVDHLQYVWNVKEDIINTTRFVIEGHREGKRWIEVWYCERIPTKPSMSSPMSGVIRIP